MASGQSDDEATAGVVRYRVVVTGLVQGVWFRESCRREAASLGVSGWVRNRADGAVEAHLEGREVDVARVVAWCRIGPPSADVTGLEVAAEEPVGALSFQVR